MEEPHAREWPGGGSVAPAEAHRQVQDPSWMPQVGVEGGGERGIQAWGAALEVGGDEGEEDMAVDTEGEVRRAVGLVHDESLVSLSADEGDETVELSCTSEKIGGGSGREGSPCCPRQRVSSGSPERADKAEGLGLGSHACGDAAGGSTIGEGGGGARIAGGDDWPHTSMSTLGPCGSEEELECSGEEAACQHVPAFAEGGGAIDQGFLQPSLASREVQVGDQTGLFGSEESMFDEGMLANALAQVRAMHDSGLVADVVWAWRGEALRRMRTRRTGELVRELAKWNSMHETFRILSAAAVGNQRRRRNLEFAADKMHAVALMQRVLYVWGPLLQIETAEAIGTLDRNLRRIFSVVRVSARFRDWDAAARTAKRIRTANAKVVGLRGKRIAREGGKAVVAWHMVAEWRASLRTGLRKLAATCGRRRLAWGLEGLRMALVGGEAGLDFMVKVCCKEGFDAWVTSCWAGLGGVALAVRVCEGFAARSWRDFVKHQRRVSKAVKLHGVRWAHIRSLLGLSAALEAWRETVGHENQREEELLELLEFHCYDTRANAAVAKRALEVWHEGVRVQYGENWESAQGLLLRGSWRRWRTECERKAESKAWAGVFRQKVTMKLAEHHDRWRVVKALGSWMQGSWDQKEKRAKAERVAEGRALKMACKFVLGAFDTWRKRRLQRMADEVQSFREHRRLVETWRDFKGACLEQKQWSSLCGASIWLRGWWALIANKVGRARNTFESIQERRLVMILKLWRAATVAERMVKRKSAEVEAGCDAAGLRLRGRMCREAVERWRAAALLGRAVIFHRELCILQAQTTVWGALVEWRQLVAWWGHRGILDSWRCPEQLACLEAMCTRGEERLLKRIMCKLRSFIRDRAFTCNDQSSNVMAEELPRQSPPPAPIAPTNLAAPLSSDAGDCPVSKVDGRSTEHKAKIGGEREISEPRENEWRRDLWESLGNEKRGVLYDMRQKQLQEQDASWMRGIPIPVVKLDALEFPPSTNSCEPEVWTTRGNESEESRASTAEKPKAIPRRSLEVVKGSDSQLAHCDCKIPLIESAPLLTDDDSEMTPQGIFKSKARDHRDKSIHEPHKPDAVKELLRQRAARARINKVDGQQVVEAVPDAKDPNAHFIKLGGAAARQSLHIGAASSKHEEISNSALKKSSDNARMPRQAAQNNTCAARAIPVPVLERPEPVDKSLDGFGKCGDGRLAVLAQRCTLKESAVHKGLDGCRPEGQLFTRQDDGKKQAGNPSTDHIATRFLTTRGAGSATSVTQWLTTMRNWKVGPPAAGCPHLWWVSSPSQVTVRTEMQGAGLRLVNQVRGVESFTDFAASLDVCEHVAGCGCEDPVTNRRVCDMFPKSYSLARFLQLHADGSLAEEEELQGPWIIKDGSRRDEGKKMTSFIVASSEDTIRRHSLLFPSGNPDSSSMFVVQRYIQRPLLVYGCKFTLNSFVLIARVHPLLAFYHEGYARLAMEPYFEQDTENIFAHLTSYRVQRVHGDYARRGKHTVLAIDKLAAEVSSMVVGKPADPVEEWIKPQLKAAIRHVLKSGQQQMDRTGGHFCILGVDAVIDNDLNVHVTRISRNPPLRTHHKDVDQTMADMVCEATEIAVQSNTKTRDGCWSAPSCLEDFEFLVG